MTSHPLIPLNVKCIVDSCERPAVGSHAVCQVHLFIEVVVTAAFGVFAVIALIKAALVLAARG